MNMKAKRYNTGKLRYDLIPKNALRELAKVYTLGAHKYTVYKDKTGMEIMGKDIDIRNYNDYEIIDNGDNNWRLGQNWMSVYASVQRHLESWAMGEDIDQDQSMQTKHLANAAWGLLTLLEYYTIYPQGDDRTKRFLEVPNIALDIDEVICDWVAGWCKYWNFPIPTNWQFDYNIKEKFDKLSTNKEFWLGLNVKIKPEDIPFEPACYITSRPIPIEWTKEWLQTNGFSCAPVFCVKDKKEKIEIAKQQKVEIFVDDCWDTFKEFNKNNITCYLFDTPHNRRYTDVGYLRINSLKQLIERL